MKHSSYHYIAAKECPYSILGRKLTELRRAELRNIAMRIEVDGNLPKNDMLQQTISKLNAIEAPAELSELSDLQ